MYDGGKTRGKTRGKTQKKARTETYTKKRENFKSKLLIFGLELKILRKY